MEGETEKLGEAPKEEVRVWGLGLTNNKLDKIIELLDRNNFLTAKMEAKIDKLLER